MLNYDTKALVPGSRGHDPGCDPRRASEYCGTCYDYDDATNQQGTKS
jgi:hypothetical protein